MYEALHGTVQEVHTDVASVVVYVPLLHVVHDDAPFTPYVPGGFEVE